jgi:hypothetical protein
MIKALRRPPTKLKGSIRTPLVRKATTKERITTIKRTSLKPRKAMAIRVIIFPNPNLTPGTGMGIGIKDSKNEMTIALQTKIIMIAYLLDLFINIIPFYSLAILVGDTI